MSLTRRTRIGIVIAAVAIIIVVVCLCVGLFFKSNSLIDVVDSGNKNVGKITDTSENVKNEKNKMPMKRAKMKPILRNQRKIVESRGFKEEEEDKDTELSPAEKMLADKIEKALDEEDINLARECVSAALKCTNTEIRQSMVDTLGWFGGKALAELTPFLADPDEDVAESAFNEWDMAISDIEDEQEKVTIAEMAMLTITNEDVLESVSNEYIGMDEKRAVESLLHVIENGTPEGIAKAKETYEFVTGDEFISRAAAEKWIAEEYEPSEE